MDLTKLHDGEWLLNARQSSEDPGIVNIETSSTDGGVLEYRVATIKPRPPLHSDKGQTEGGCDEKGT